MFKKGNKYGMMHKGIKRSEETKARMRIALKDRKMPKGFGKRQRLNKLGNNANDICRRRIQEAVNFFESNGFRCIPITKVIPDIIAIKDGKVIAIEVEYGSSPNYPKYDIDNYREKFDEVIWYTDEDEKSSSKIK